MGSAGAPGARVQGSGAPDEGPSVGCGISGKGAAWGCAGARHGAAQRRSSVGPRRGAAWGCVGAAKGHSVVRCRGAAVWGGAGAQ